MALSFQAALGLAVVMCAAGAAPVSAQGANPGLIKHRNDCRLAEQVLTRGQPANKREWALQLIGSCPEGADVVLGLWTAPPSSDSELDALYLASVYAADERVFEVALSVAQDPAARALLRLAALGTVVTYVRGDIVIHSVEGISRFEGFPPLEWDNVWGTMDHPLLREGQVSLPPGSDVLVTEFVQELAEDGDAPPLLRDSAWWLLGQLGLEPCKTGPGTVCSPVS